MTSWTSSASARPGCAGAIQDLSRHIKSSIGVSVDVKVVEPGRIERSLGKAKRIVDLRPKG